MSIIHTPKISHSLKGATFSKPPPLQGDRVTLFSLHLWISGYQDIRKEHQTRQKHHIRNAQFVSNELSKTPKSPYQSSSHPTIGMSECIKNDPPILPTQFLWRQTKIYIQNYKRHPRKWSSHSLPTPQKKIRNILLHQHFFKRWYILASHLFVMQQLQFQLPFTSLEKFPFPFVNHHLFRIDRIDQLWGWFQDAILASSYMGVSKKNGTPKSSILIGVFHHKPSILGYPYFRKHPYQCSSIYFMMKLWTVFDFKPFQTSINAQLTMWGPKFHVKIFHQLVHLHCFFFSIVFES